MRVTLILALGPEGFSLGLFKNGPVQQMCTTNHSLQYTYFPTQCTAVKTNPCYLVFVDDAFLATKV